MSIIVKDITKKYGSQFALNNVSFEIATGDIVGFLGPNGAGKSTMMKIITGFIPPNSGSVFVNGKDAIEESLEVRKEIGYLPEHNPQYLNMYVKEYLEFTAKLYGLKKDLPQKVKKIVELTGLTVEQHKKIKELSKGYRQRVGIAQALIHDPKVLILDEPTTGLDPNQIVEIRNLISHIGKEKTVMLSTHIMQEVEAICDKVIIVNKGEIVANDSAKNIHKYTQDTSNFILVEFNQAINASLLNQIEGIEDIIPQEKDNTWLIKSGKTKDVRSDIFNFAVKNQIEVLSLQKQEKNLEQIFQELTSTKS